MGAITMEQEQELSIEEVARRLRISYRTAYKRIVEQRLIRARREGNLWRVRERDLQEYIESTFEDKPQDKPKADPDTDEREIIDLHRITHPEHHLGM